MLLTLTASCLIILDNRQSYSCNSCRAKEPLKHLRMTARSLRGRNTRSEKVARREQFSVLLRRIVGTTQRKRTEKWTAVALLQ
jgi:hypothetical protein